MKFKSLIPLILILAILAGLVAVKKMNKKETTIVEQVGLVSLLPSGLAKTDIAKLDIYSGEKADAKITLTYDQPSDKWRVASSFNAPVAKDKIDKFLDAVAGVKGEFRSTATDDAGLEDYGLTDAKAFHVLAYKKDATDAAVHLLVGKAPGTSSVFMRTSDKKDVFVEGANLKQMAGVYGDDEGPQGMPPGAPKPEAKGAEPDIWFDKQIIDLDKDAIKKIALTTPDKAINFEKREKPKAAEGEVPAEGEAKTEGEKPAPAPEFEWALASGGPGGATTFKQKGLDSLLTKLDSLQAASVVDPAKKAEWGLETPSFKCVVSQDGKDDVVIEAGRPNPSGDGYIRIAGAKDDLVYSLSKYNFEQLFPKGMDLFDLAPITLDKNALQAIEVKDGASVVSLVKLDAKWNVLQPACDLPAQTSAVDGIANTIASLKPQDFADAAAAQGEPTRTITAVAGASPVVVKFYGDSKSIDGVVASVEGQPFPVVISRADVTKLFTPAKDLFQRQVFKSLDSAEIKTIDATGPAGAWQLAQTEGKWTFSVAGAAPAEAGEEACKAVASAVEELQGVDIAFGQSDLAGTPVATMNVTMNDGTAHSVAFAAEANGNHPAKASGANVVIQVAAGEFAKLFPAADTFKKPEAPAAAPADAAVPAAAPAGATQTIQLDPSALGGGTVSVTPAPADAPAEQTPPSQTVVLEPSKQ